MARPKIPPAVRKQRLRIGTRIRQERERLGFSQREVASRVGIERFQYQRIEDGIGKLDIVIIEQISKVFGHANAEAFRDELTELVTTAA